MNTLFSCFMLAVMFINGASCADGDRQAGVMSGAVEQEPGGKQSEVRVLEGQGDGAFTARNFDEAIAKYKSAIALTPDGAELHYKLGLTYGHKMMLDEAIASLSTAVRLDPNHAKACNNLGLAYERKAQLREAIPQYEKAVSINPDYAQAHYNLGRCYSLKRNQQPELRLRAAEHYYKAGMLFLKQGDTQTAVAAYNYLKQLDSKELENALREKLPPESQTVNGSTSP